MRVIASPSSEMACGSSGMTNARTEWPWCLAVGLWAFRLPTPAYTYMDNYTFVTPDFIPRPIYDEVRQYAVPGAAGGTP